MREIKFRAWDKAGQRMGSVSDLQFARPWGGDVFEPSVELLFGTIGTDFLVSDVVLMQSTGLHDKNEKEIYEGDIIRGIDIEERAPVFSVSWLHSSARFQLLHEDLEYGAPINGSWSDQYEIIGNMYENPELLK